MTPEGKVKEAVKKLLREHAAWWFCPVQNGMGSPGLDFLPVIHRGKCVAIETKRPGGHLTTRQERTKRDIENAGGRVLVIDGDLGELLQWLQE